MYFMFLAQVLSIHQYVKAYILRQIILSYNWEKKREEHFKKNLIIT